MAVKFKEYAIGEVAEVIGGSTPSTADDSNFGGDIPWLTPKDLSRAHDRYIKRGERNLTKKGLASCSAQILPKNSVLLSSRAPIGYLAIAANPITTNQGFRSLIMKPGFDHEFVYYWLLGNLDELERRSTGSTFKELSGSALKEIKITVPPLPEQRAIAHILGTLDDKIELNRKMNETLEAMARALFKSWFVDFDPVRAKAEGRDTGLPKEIADLFPDEFEDSELGEIPKGWKVKPFVETVEVLGGGTPKTTVLEYWNGSIPWFSVVDAPRETDVWVMDTEKTISPEGIENSSTKVLPKGTTIISARGTVGRLALVGVPMAMNQSCYGLRGIVPDTDLFTYFSTKTLVGTLQKHAHGSVFDTITRETLSGVLVVMPGENLLRVFETKVTPLVEGIRSRLLETQCLVKIRDVLLPVLISGSVGVEELAVQILTNGR